MSYIDTFDHEFIGFIAGLPIYLPLETVTASDIPSEFGCSPQNLIIGGGDGEHPAIIVTDLLKPLPISSLSSSTRARVRLRYRMNSHSSWMMLGLGVISCFSLDGILPAMRRSSNAAKVLPAKLHTIRIGSNLP